MEMLLILAQNVRNKFFPDLTATREGSILDRVLSACILLQTALQTILEAAPIIRGGDGDGDGGYLDHNSQMLCHYWVEIAYLNKQFVLDIAADRWGNERVKVLDKSSDTLARRYVPGAQDEINGIVKHFAFARQITTKSLSKKIETVSAALETHAVAKEIIDDFEAISTWIRSRGGRSVHTFAAYRKEAQRLLSWLSQKKITLKMMQVEDANNYLSFLSEMPADKEKRRKDTCNSLQSKMAGDEKKYTPSSIQYTRSVLSQMNGYLVDLGYLQRNIFKLSSIQAELRRTTQSRFLDLDSWLYLWAWINDQENFEDEGENRRARWLFALLYHTGLRLEETSKAKMGDLVRTNGFWSLRVVGKRSKERFVTINSALLEELHCFRRYLKLSDIPMPGENFPLVPSFRKSGTLTPRAISKIVQKIAEAAAKKCTDQHIANRIIQISPHWMRHTNATHRLMAGASLESTQDELGHNDPRTTRIYAKTVDSTRRLESEKLVLLQS